MTFALLLVALAAALSLISFGGGLYEVSVLDPVWPRNPQVIRPEAGGASRRRFWIPAHAMFEVTLIAALVGAWGQGEARFWLLVALAFHLVMRGWSALDFIPKAIAFERADAPTGPAAERWVARSRLRLVLDLGTCGSLLAALVLLARAT